MLCDVTPREHLGLPNKKATPPEPGHDDDDDLAFREQCCRQLARPLSARMKYGFCRVVRPVLDEPGVRVFDSTRAYRAWCAAHLPDWLGFKPAPAE